MPAREQKLPFGNAVVGFDTMEEFFAYQAKKEAEANANVVSSQREIGYGCWVVRLVPQLAIWGWIPSFDEVCAMERKYYANLRGYFEFGARNRPEGWNLFATLLVPLGR